MPAAPRVLFYVLADADEEARRGFACRLVEKAYQQDHRVLVRCRSGEDASHFDELLWRFSDRSFVPHELQPADGRAAAPVTVSGGGEPAGEGGVLVNLADDVPPWYGRFEHIAELVGADDTSRRAGRDRFRFYREHGIEPETHNLGAG